MTNDNTAEQVAENAEMNEGSGQTQDATPEARIAALEEKLAAMKNEALRHLADADNTRKRALKEKEETAKYAVSKFARDMLDVADNLQRALGAVKPEMLEGNPAIKNLCAGVDATERQLAAIFERFGIKKIESVGQKFNPNHHQVVVELDVPDKEPGTVVQELQTGYMIQDRLLREAMVGIAKGGAAKGSVDIKG